MKYVIYKSFGKYKMTDEDNYYARFRDARKVINCDNCKTANEVIQCLSQYCPPETQFIIKEEN